LTLHEDLILFILTACAMKINTSILLLNSFHRVVLRDFYYYCINLFRNYWI